MYIALPARVDNRLQQDIINGHRNLTSQLGTLTSCVDCDCVLAGQYSDLVYFRFEHLEKHTSLSGMLHAICKVFQKMRDKIKASILNSNGL